VYEAELNAMLRLGLSLDVACAVRYPRDNVPTEHFDADTSASLELGKSRTLRAGDDATILVYGALAVNALLAAEQLASEGMDIEVIDARFCKPLDGAMLRRVLQAGRPVLTVEDHHHINGFGTAVAEFAVANKLPTERLEILGMPDSLLPHMTRPQQLEATGLDAPGIAARVRAMMAASASLAGPDAFAKSRR